jgi:hypothetical protein
MVALPLFDAAKTLAAAAGGQDQQQRNGKYAKHGKVSPEIHRIVE